MDCIGKCKHGAITYTRRKPKNETATSEDTKVKSVTTEQVDNARRSFLSASAIFATTSVLKAQEKKVDGGLATIEDKRFPQRENPIYPPGALSARNFTQHCTACQLCVSVCPNQVLRPSDNLLTLMQPEMSYERGIAVLNVLNVRKFVPPALFISPVLPRNQLFRSDMPYGLKRTVYL